MLTLGRTLEDLKWASECLLAQFFGACPSRASSICITASSVRRGRTRAVTATAWLSIPGRRQWCPELLGNLSRRADRVPDPGKPRSWYQYQTFLVWTLRPLGAKCQVAPARHSADRPSPDRPARRRAGKMDTLLAHGSGYPTGKRIRAAGTRVPRWCLTRLFLILFYKIPWSKLGFESFTCSWMLHIPLATMQVVARYYCKNDFKK